MELAQASRQTLYRRIRAGELPTYKRGGDRRRVLFRREDVEKLALVLPVAGSGGDETPPYDGGKAAA
jgi:excisionase family DNA binding protein